MTRLALDTLAAARRDAHPRGITSICSAHPLVIRAAIENARDSGMDVLIEATCNQVNQFGGYTGMRPSDFAGLVHGFAASCGLGTDRVLLGGDHLGPNPWRTEGSASALEKAEAMVRDYVQAGFRKIHLDASMGCAGEPPALDDEATAQRAARLARAAEDAAASGGLPPPLYIIGTEVPPPGGADHALSALTPTTAAAARETIDIHRRVFREHGLDDAFSRVIGLVVQPGVEFGNQNVIRYDRPKAEELTRLLDTEPQFVFEAHSTDYQGEVPLRQLVEDGFSILKVGPELTFVLREAIYALDLIASDLFSEYGQRPLYTAMEELMCAEPEHWERHYQGDANQKRALRHYSLSDRIRYYWVAPTAQLALRRLVDALSGARVPSTLLRQHFPAAEHFAGSPLDPEAVMMWRVEQSLRAYARASGSD